MANNSKKPDDDFQWNKILKHISLAVLIFVGFIYLSQFITGYEERVDLQYYSELITLVDKGVVKSLNYYEGQNGKPAYFEGEFKETQNYSNNATKTPRGYKYFKVAWPQDNKVDFEYVSKKVPNIRVLTQENTFMDVIIGLLPWILIIGLFFLFTRRMQSGMGGGKGGGGGIFSIGKIRTTMLTKDEIKTTFADVSGCDEAKVELEEVIGFLKSPAKYQKLGGKIPKGVLLTGSPGTGKTLLAKAVAGEAGVPFFSISGSDFVEMFVGVGASRVRDLFEQGRKNAPCIIFIDEIDAVGRQRGVGLGGGNDEREQTLNALLVEMDGFETSEGVIIMAATNRPDVLDSALMRPGRFDRRIVIERPDIKGRIGILKVHTRKIPLSPDVDIERLAMGIPGFSGADIANFVNEAALLAARYDKDKVEMDDFENAKDKVILGLERKSLMMKEEDKLATAIHEAGHTIIGRLIKSQDEVYKVTIIPRGFALGVTWTMPKDDVVTHSREFLLGKICMLMGGRVAEKIKFSHYSSGAGNDIQHATEIARRMVCEFGMSDEIGPINFRDKSSEQFSKAISEKTAELIDSEIKRIIKEQEERAEKLLRENINILEKVSSELMIRETLNAVEVQKLMNGEELEEFIKKPKRTDKDRLQEIEKLKTDSGKNDSKESNDTTLNPIPA